MSGPSFWIWCIGAVLVGVGLVAAMAMVFKRPRGASGGPAPPEPASATAPADTGGLLGRTLGRYRLVGKLGTGGMAVVYRASPMDGGPTVAVKVLNAQYAREPQIRSRFSREAIVCSELHHAGIVRVTDWGEEGEYVYLVMELVPGEPLRRRIRPDAPIGEVTALLRQVLDAMAYAHKQGCVHRDLKPGNIMVTPSGRVKVLDFGLVRRDDFRTLTASGQVMGSMGYMAPEQMAGHAPDERCDQYTLGVIAYELLTGSNPFRGMMTDYVDGLFTPEPVAVVRPEVPQALSDVVARMMATDPEDRFETLEAARVALDRARGA